MTVDFGLLPKDCACIHHTGLHFLHMDRLMADKSLSMLEAGNIRGFLVNETARLRSKFYAAARYARPGESCLFPAGYRETDYEQRVKAVLQANRARSAMPRKGP